MAVKIVGSVEASAGSPLKSTIPLEGGREKLHSNVRTRRASGAALISGLSCEKMQSLLRMMSVWLVVFFVVGSYGALDVFCAASAAGEQHLRRSPQSDLTGALRQHNASSLLATLAREAGRGIRLTPEEASLLLAATENHAESESSSVAVPYFLRGKMRETDSEQGADVDSIPLYGKLGDTLLAARGVADKAREQLSQFWGLQNGGSNLLHWWRENGAAAVRAAMTSLFGKETPSPDDATVKEMGALLAALQQQQQQQKYSALFTGLPIGARDTQSATATLGSDRKSLYGGWKEKHPGLHIFPEQRYSRTAAPDAPAGLAEFTAGRDESASQAVHSPVFEELDRSRTEKEQMLGTLSQLGRSHPFLSVLSGDPGKPLEGILQTGARAFELAGAAGNEALEQNDLSSLLPYGLPSMRFSALSILTEGNTLKNWTSLVKMQKEYGQTDYTSAAARDVMEKLAVVLACAYKTAKTLLGEHQAVSLIRAAIRQNASFQEQIYSAVRRYMDGGEPAEDAAQLTDGSTSKQKGPKDVESRLLQGLLKRVLHMPASFFHQLSQKHRKTLDQWGVDADELQSTVKEALYLNFPPREGETPAQHH